MMEIDILTGFIQTMRALAIFAGILVAIDCFRIFAHQDDIPHSPIDNAIAWLCVAAGGSLGGTGLIAYGQPTVGGQDGIWPNFVVMFIWSSLAVSLVWRASARAHTPKLIWISAIAFAVSGTSLTVLSMM